MSLAAESITAGMDPAGMDQRVLESSAVQCAHCGLPVPRALIDARHSEQFCCAGCRSVYRLICDAGLTQYYALRRQTLAEQGAPLARPAERTDSRYADFDAPAFQSQYTEQVAPGSSRVELFLEGVHCAACLWLVEKLPSLVSGVHEARLDLQRRALEVLWDPQQVALSRIARELDSLGYPPRPYNDVRAQAGRRAEERRLLVRVGVAGAIAGNVMLLSFALYSGAFQGMALEFRRLFEVASMVISVPSVSYCAMEFYRGAWSSLKTRTPHMDLPVSLGILAGAVWGGASVVRGQGEVWFDSVTALIFLLLVGRFVELRQQNRARQAVERAQMFTPSSAHVIGDDGSVRDVLVEEVQPGQLVLVKSGETVPVDGVVAVGRSELDNRILTGESKPVGVGPGAEVFAGATNLTGVIRVRSTNGGAETRVARLMREVERARLRRPRVVRLVDRLAGRFVVAVLMLALATLALWWPYDPAAALEHTIALLVVACPCALGMATPLTVSAALARAAERLVLIKGGDVLEVVRKPCLIVFDKTGTLTTGNLRLRAWKGERHVQGLVRALEATSSHPIAWAFCRSLPELPGATIDEAYEEPGGGIRGRVGGRSVAVGAPAWVARLGNAEPDWARAEVLRWSELGHTPVAVAVEGVVVAVACFDDPVTRDAVQSLSKLRRLGYHCAVLSGDHHAVTRSVAQALASAAGEPRLFDDVVGAASPEEKLAYVTAQKRNGPVIVVGDGVNDAAALAAASVGVATKGGAEASLLAADVYLGKTGLAQLVVLIEGARYTFSTIKRGICMSLGYNMVMVGLAMAGWIGPLLAAILMPLSSLSVVANAYRSKVFERLG